MTRPEGSFGDLIPELKDWNNGAGIDIDSWIACVGNWEHAIGYGRLFWPEFVEHDGCIFRATAFDEASYLQWRATLKDDRRGIQAVMNHVHIADMFGDTSTDPTEAQIVCVGGMLKDIWGAKLDQMADSLLKMVKRATGRDPEGHSSAQPSREAPLFVYVKIPAPIGPLERGTQFEDPLQAALDAANLGEVTGGGSQLGDPGPDGSPTIEFCGIDVDLFSLDPGLALLRRELTRLGAPEGAQLRTKSKGASTTSRYINREAAQQ